MTDDWIMPEYMAIRGPGAGVEIKYGDEKINRCRKDPDWPSDCQTCPARARCDELVREEWARKIILTCSYCHCEFEGPGYMFELDEEGDEYESVCPDCAGELGL